MKTRKTLLVVGAGLALLGSAACNNDNLTNLNKNPNSPTDVPAGAIFTYATRLAVSRWLGAGSPDLRGTEWVAQQLAEVQYPDEDDYKRLQGGQTAGNFDNAYQGELEDYRKIIQKGMATKDAGVWAPAMIMRSWVFANLTDMFGDVPYSQALTGDSAATTLTPKYDKQQDIYKALFAALDSAVKALNGASNSLGGADPIYNGDPQQWRKFANALRMRLALRTVNVDAALANAQISASLADGALLTSNADNAALAWPGDGVYNNPWADFFKTRDDNRMSKTLMDVLLANNDPRTGIYAQPAQDQSIGKYVGEPNGLATVDAGQWAKTASRIGTVLFPPVTAYGTFAGAAGQKWPSFLFTAAEMNFILAEVSERSLVSGYTPAQAAAYYNAGITASLNQWGVTDATTIANYLAQPGVVYQGGTAGLNQIATQKWIALFTDGGTAWFEWRRTCVPTTVTTTVPGTAFSNKYIPRRFMYSPTEFSVNSDNVTAAAATLGAAGDSFNGIMYVDAVKNAPTYVAGACNAP